MAQLLKDGIHFFYFWCFISLMWLPWGTLHINNGYPTGICPKQYFSHFLVYGTSGSIDVSSTFYYVLVRRRNISKKEVLAFSDFAQNSKYDNNTRSVKVENSP